MLRIERTRIENGSEIGVQVNAARFIMNASVVAKNRSGGVAILDGGNAEVTNSIFTRNGSTSGAPFGALRVDAPEARIEHNTLAYNEADAAADPPMSGGLHCLSGIAAPNNIIYGNRLGTTTQVPAQVSGACVTTSSIVSGGDGTNEMHFVSDAWDSPDCHLADDTGPAVGAAVPGAVTDDVDGEARPNGAPDVGADERYP